MALLPWSAGYVPSSEVFKNVDRSQFSHAEHQVSNEEFDRRHKAIRTFMDEKGLDCLLIAGGSTVWNRGFTNMRWVTGHVGCEFTHFEYVVFPRIGETTIVTFPILVTDPGRRGRPIVEDVRGALNFAATAADRLKELGYSKGRIGIVTIDGQESIPLNQWKVLTQELPEANFEFVTRDWWWQVRLIKSEEEIEFLERAAEIGDRMHEAVAEHIQPGMTEADVFAWMHHAMLHHGGDIPTMVLAVSFNMFEGDGNYLHETPHNRVLKKGDIILTEIAPRYPDGSECQTGRSFCLM